MTTRQIALTDALVSRAERPVAEPGLPPDIVACTDAEIADTAAAIRAGHVAGTDFWVFAYGSLLWSPAIAHVEERLAVARGWHRSFCMRIEGHRGTREQPGLMMALDRGGQCRGVALRIAGDALEGELERLVRRELPVRRLDGAAFHLPRWVPVATAQGPLRALTFVINRLGPAYAGGLPPEDTADMLAAACGEAGSCAAYLQQTVLHLEARGIRDRNLWHLQALVAQRLAAQPDPAPGIVA
jgi:cation transport protein ChaC